MKAGKHNNFHRRASKIKGAEKANEPRSHAEEPAGADTKKANPQRMDLFRRMNLSSRKNNDDV